MSTNKLPDSVAEPPHRTRLWRDGKLIREDFPIEDVSEYVDKPGCVVWADLCAPTPSTLRVIADELSIDPHAVEDVLSRHERPKLLRYPNFIFLGAIALSFDEKTAALKTSRVSAFVFHSCLLTIRDGDLFGIEDTVARWDDQPNLVETGTFGLLHSLLDSIVDGQWEVLEALDDELDSMEEDLFERGGLNRETQQRAFQLRRALVSSRRAVLPMREVVQPALHKAVGGGEPEQLVPLYEDLYDHVQRSIEWSDSLRDMMTTIFDTNLTLKADRLNTITKKVTSWAAIIAVPTLVTGYYGQNVAYPGFGTHWGFWLSNAIMAVAVVVLYLMFKRKDWL